MQHIFHTVVVTAEDLEKGEREQLQLDISNFVAEKLVEMLTEGALAQTQTFYFKDDVHGEALVQ
jgi:hypothetical protein